MSRAHQVRQRGPDRPGQHPPHHPGRHADQRVHPRRDRDGDGARAGPPCQQGYPALHAVETVSTVVGLYLASLALEWGVGYFGFQGAGDIAALPLFMLVMGVYGLVTMPLTNAFSRWRELQADRYALEMHPQRPGLCLRDDPAGQPEPGRGRPRAVGGVPAVFAPGAGEADQMARDYAPKRIWLFHIFHRAMASSVSLGLSKTRLHR